MPPFVARDQPHLVDVPADQLGVSERGLAAGVKIAYAVAAVDALGEGAPSAPVAATTWDVPGAPTDVAVACGPGLVGESTVSWHAPTSDGGAAALTYRVYRDGELVAIVDAATTSWTDTGLSPARAYVYAVSAENVVGGGAQSEAACGTPSPWSPELGCRSLL